MPDGPRLLVAEGNTAAARKKMAELSGATAAEGYAAVLRRLQPDAIIDICLPSDPDPQLSAPLASYDGVVVTGSSLNIHRREPESLRQIAFAREIFAAGVPMFGSCWGLQVATVAAGGDVGANPRGREVAFARGVRLTEVGQTHPMHSGRALIFDAPAIHADEVATVAPGTIVTAANAMSQVQAAEIVVGGASFWGVQYHPEYTLDDIALVVRRYAQTLVDDGAFASLDAAQAYERDLQALSLDPNRRDIAGRLDIGADLLSDAERNREIVNWLAHKVLRKP